MAVPTSGELSIFKLSQEKRIDDYNSSAGAGAIPKISLADLVLGENTQKIGGFDWDATNTNSSSYPNNSQPHSFSEWYGYDHNAPPPAFLEVKAYELDSFTTGTGTSISQLSGSSHRLSAFNKHQHSYIKVKMLDNTFDQLRFTYNISGMGFLEIYTGASDDATAPTDPKALGWSLYSTIDEGSGTQLVNGSAGSVIYIHMYWPLKQENSFLFSNMYCQPRQ